MNESVNFEELPQALVEEVLKRTDGIEQELLQSFEELRVQKEDLRKQLVDTGLLKDASSLPVVQSPTTCGVDGSYAIERLLATDVVVAGAVAVEGLIPPSETRCWPDPKHRIHIETEAHNADTGTILQAMMIGMELILAQQAPHDLVLLDGSFTTPIIRFNQGFSKAREHPDLKIVKEYLAQKIKRFLEAYYEVLSSQRTDRQWVAVPKYTTRQEIANELGWDDSYDDRGLLSSVLDAGEYTDPILLEQPNTGWHLDTSVVNDSTTAAECNVIKEQVIRLLRNIHVLYYRPRAYMPTLRLEMSRAIANNPTRLSIVLQGIRDQYSKAAIMEPYPLYMADRMVKHLPQTLPACVHRISQYLAKNYQGDIDDVFISLHSYRTESGR